MKSTPAFILVIAVLGGSATFTACKESAPHDQRVQLTDKQHQKVSFTVLVPAGWSQLYSGGTGAGDWTSVLLNTEEDNLTKAEIELVENEPGPTSLDELVAATGAKFKLIDKETTPNGFGVTFNDGRRDMFLYYANVGGRKLSCKPDGIGYDAKFLADCKKICASIR